MVIHWSTPYSEDADEAAEQEQFERAATLRARSAQSRLERLGIESTASSDLAVGDLLYAIYYARRAGADERAIHLRTLLESYAKLLQHASYRRLQEHWPETTDSCLVGLHEEWMGTRTCSPGRKPRSGTTTGRSRGTRSRHSERPKRPTRFGR